MKQVVSPLESPLKPLTATGSCTRPANTTARNLPANSATVQPNDSPCCLGGLRARGIGRSSTPRDLPATPRRGKRPASDCSANPPTACNTSSMSSVASIRSASPAAAASAEADKRSPRPSPTAPPSPAESSTSPRSASLDRDEINKALDSYLGPQVWRVTFDGQPTSVEEDNRPALPSA